ncbi:hypothetical protein TNCV_2695651 [Trichonephila clavipes]|nr:hypothetical protein TNCV_2695651 [Trichonephila clavipes]
MRKKGDNRLVPGPDYMVDAFKFSNKAPRVIWRVTIDVYGMQYLFCWPILAVSSQSLASNGPIIDSRYLNLVFGPTKATHYRLFLSIITKYTVEPSWMLVRVWLPFELLHRALTMIVFTQYCRM